MSFSSVVVVLLSDVRRVVRVVVPWTASDDPAFPPLRATVLDDFRAFVGVNLSFRRRRPPPRACTVVPFAFFS
uniref:Putative secreted protein n=1 Tax=Anopheles marajoara TaxID=58244 RepID=A0A2M4CDS0_9DIPT